MFKATLDMVFEAAQKVKDIGAKNIVVTLLLMVIVGMGLMLSQQMANVQSHFPTPAVENTRFVNGIKTDQLILKALEDARVQVGADRVVINQFHNNQVDIGGVPFMKSSVTYKAMGPDVGWDPELSQDIPISTWNSVFQQMYAGYNTKPKCVGVARDGMTDSNLRARYVKAGTTYIVACPILSLAGGTIGMVTVGYTDLHKKVLGDDKVFPVIGALGERVGGYLQEVHLKKDAPSMWNPLNWFGGKKDAEPSEK